jgi:hypothetical protein
VLKAQDQAAIYRQEELPPDCVLPRPGPAPASNLSLRRPYPPPRGVGHRLRK